MAATAISGACLGNTEASSCSIAAMPVISMRSTAVTRAASTGPERQLFVASSRFCSRTAVAREGGFSAAPACPPGTPRKARSLACYLRTKEAMADWTAAAAIQLTDPVCHRAKVMAMAAGPAVPAGETTAIVPDIPVRSGGGASAEAADAEAASQFIRPHLRKLAPYTPIEPFEILSARLGFDVTEIVKLDANENLYGPPPEVLQALGSMDFPNIYPDPESRRLRAALSKDIGIEMEYLLAGCGADELIDLIMRCTLDPGDKIVDCPPTFTMYAFDAAVNGVEVVQVPRLPGFQIDVEGIKTAVKEHEPKAIFLTSPNNPDGSVLGDDDLLEILELPVLVILDEAYIEFAKIETRMSWVKQFPNLIVLRTFSKRAGLAGLRVGYGAFPLGLIAYLWRAKQPYNVSVAAEIAACAALTNPSYLESVKSALVEERERLFGLLSEIPFLRPYPSHANFILCSVLGGMDAKKLKADLAAKKIMVRHYDKELLSGYIRVSVGKPEHTDALMKALWSIAGTQS